MPQILGSLVLKAKFENCTGKTAYLTNTCSVVSATHVNLSDK